MAQPAAVTEPDLDSSIDSTIDSFAAGLAYASRSSAWRVWAQRCSSTPITRTPSSLVVSSASSVRPRRGQEST